MNKFFGGLLPRLAAVALASFAAGFLNGFVGSGGGIFLVLLFSVLYRSGSHTSADAFASSLFCTLPMSAVSLYFYVSGGTVIPSEAYYCLIPAALGGSAGALLCAKLKAPVLNRIFAALMAFAGIMLLRR